MSETKWTPGPWKVVPTPEGTFGKEWVQIWANRRPVVVHGEYSTNRYGELETVAGVQISEANAHLIAAAPDLYAAAEAFVAINECACLTIDDAPFDDDKLPEQWEREQRGKCHWHKARAALARARGES